MNIDITVKEIDELCYLYFLIYKNQNAEQAFLYVAENLYFNTLGGDLKNTKQYFVKNNKETLYLNIEELELKNEEDEDDTFNIADFFINNKYMSKVISSKVLKLCLNQLSHFQLNNNSIRLPTHMIELYKYKNNKYEMNLGHMVRQLKDYVSSNDSFYKLESDGCIENQSFLYGINYYDTLIEMLYNANGAIDKRNFHILCDHKALMLFRIHYIFKNNLISEKNMKF